MSKQEVVVTGVGVVSPFGLNNSEYWEGLCSGKPVFSQRTTSDGKEAYQVSAVPDFKPKDYLPRKGLRNLNRSINFARIAAKMALAESGFATDSLDPTRTAIVLGTNGACADHMFTFNRDAHDGFVDPLHFPNTGVSAPACQISVFEGFHCFTSTFSSGHTAGLDAIAFGCSALQQGNADVVIAGGVESLCPELLEDALQRGILPMAGENGDWVPGEGASCLILERKSDALARGAKPLAAYSGYALRFDPKAYLSGQHDVDQIYTTLTAALEEADLNPDQIDCCWSGTSGNQSLACAEQEAFNRLFGERSIPVCHPGELIGDLDGACGAFLAGTAVMSFQHQKIAGLAPEEPTMAGRIDPIHGKSKLEHCLLSGQGSTGDRSAMVLRRA